MRERRGGMARPALGTPPCVRLCRRGGIRRRAGGRERAELQGGVIVFKKVKSLKKPGSAVALQGFYLLSGSAPVTGTAVVLQDGSVQFGVTVHTTPPLGAYPFTASLEGDADFNATGEFHGIDSGVSAPMAWTPIDCKSVTLP